MRTLRWDRPSCPPTAGDNNVSLNRPEGGSLLWPGGSPSRAARPLSADDHSKTAADSAQR
eukprot:15434439-Heterocapsa_arctica.AAC.1